MVLQVCFILRPIPYFPFYVAKTDGLSFLTGTYWLATIQWYYLILIFERFKFRHILIILAVNLNTAFIICYSGLFLFLTDSKIVVLLNQKLTLLITIGAHCICTGFVVIVLNYFYRPDPQFFQLLVKGKIMLVGKM